jgi:alpha-beta hydrolase superfamily lysophospholipase
VVACIYAIEQQSELAGLICESFAFQVPAPDFALAALKGLSHIFPHAHVLPLKNADFSRDPKVVEAMNADPLIAHETQPTQTVAAMVIADERLKKEFPLIKLPVLILHGTMDMTCVAFFGPAEACDNGVLGETRTHEEGAIYRRADGDDPARGRPTADRRRGEEARRQ